MRRSAGERRRFPGDPLHDHRRAAIIRGADKSVGHTPSPEVREDAVGGRTRSQAGDGVGLPPEVTEGDQNVPAGPTGPVARGGPARLADHDVEREEPRTDHDRDFHVRTHGDLLS